MSLPPAVAGWVSRAALVLTVAGALGTGTFPPQELPRINSAAVPVIPIETDRVLAHGIDFPRSGWLLIHRQGARFRFRRLADLPSAAFAFFVAGRAGAGVAQPGERVMAAVAVSPFNVHTLTGRLLHFHRFGISSGKGQNAALLRLDAGHLLGGSRFDGFVGHTHSMTANGECDESGGLPLPPESGKISALDVHVRPF